jgi:hypothetical protein
MESMPQFTVAVVVGIIGGLLACAMVLAAARRGAQAGIFVSVLEGIAGIAGMLLALWLAPALARWLLLVGFPGAFALITAFVGLALAPFVGLHHLLQAVPDLGRVEVGPRSDRFGGLAVGVLNGLLVVGIACVVWSVAPVPASLRSDREVRRFDLGKRLLASLAHCIERNRDAREILLHGEPMGGGQNAADWTSEVFVDLNGNAQRDSGEPSIDADGNDRFSARVRYADVNANGRRDIGLLERYSLGRWDLVTVEEDLPRPTAAAGEQAR